MAWDSSRVVPWRRLVREWLVYIVIAATALTVYYLATDRPLAAGLYAGLLASGPMYIGFGALLAKFGYQRKTFKDLRAAREVQARTTPASTETTAAVRARPAPTRRTSTGPSNRPGARPASRPPNKQSNKQKRR